MKDLFAIEHLEKKLQKEVLVSLEKAGIKLENVSMVTVEMKEIKKGITHILEAYVMVRGKNLKQLLAIHLHELMERSRQPKGFFRFLS